MKMFANYFLILLHMTFLAIVYIDAGTQCSDTGTIDFNSFSNAKKLYSIKKGEYRIDTAGVRY